MRTSPLLYLVFILCSLNAIAQKTELEIIAGSAMVSLRQDPKSDADTKLKIAPVAGIGINHYINKHWSLSARFLYERKGVKVKDTIRIYDQQTIDYELTINTDYLTLPVMLRYSFGKKIEWSVGAGGFFGYMLKTQQVLKTDFLNIKSKQKQTITDQYDKMDAGICLAISVAVPLNEKLKLKVSLNESIGFIDINHIKDPSTGKEYDFKAQTNSLSLQVGIGYLLGKK